MIIWYRCKKSNGITSLFGFYILVPFLTHEGLIYLAIFIVDSSGNQQHTSIFPVKIITRIQEPHKKVSVLKIIYA